MRGEGESSLEFREVDDTYIFNASTGLYEPKTYERQDQVERKLAGTAPKHPLFVNSPPSKIVILISVLGLLVSVLTLLGLGLTVYFTRLQWQEAKRTADASICAANNASEQTKILQKQIELEYGAVVAVADPVKVDPHYISATFINYGRSPATNLIARGVLTKLSFPGGKPLWTKDISFDREAIPIPQSNGQQPADINMAHWEERVSGVTIDDEEDAAYSFQFTFSYFNGFRDTPPMTECHAYLSVKGVPEVKGTQYRFGGVQDPMTCVDLHGRMMDADQEKRRAIKGQPQD
jgi:hypothetical protein